jgi:hypothetical protein
MASPGLKPRAMGQVRATPGGLSGGGYFFCNAFW